MSQLEGLASTHRRRITIENCNSIDSAVIELESGSLNIKYGPNGIGKSTIAQALKLSAEEDGSLDHLIPFKHREDPEGPRPSVRGVDGISKVLTFDEAYVSGFTFQQDEVLKNSFEIFINTEEYRSGSAEIEAKFESLKATLGEQPDFNEAIAGFSELRSALNVTKAGSLAKTGKLVKGLSVAGKLVNIPDHLHGYQGFLQSENPAGWVSWQAQGKEFLELSDNCPFCSVGGVDKKTAISVSTEYETNAVKHMSALRLVIEKLGKYFEPNFLEQLEEITTSISGLKAEQEERLVTLSRQVDIMLQRLEQIKSISFYALKDERDVAGFLARAKIDLPNLDMLNSEATRSVVSSIDTQIDAVAAQIADVQRELSQQNTRVSGLIRRNQNSINNFLKSAGYKYTVQIEPSADTYRMLLKHQDASGHIAMGSQHLSYGEKNAFALVLFMHHVQSERPDVAILDDPVSSFDKTKKFAILGQLFRGSDSLRDVTTLLLTHDIEPAIDIIRTSVSGKFSSANPSVHFLSFRDGVVSEKPVLASDVSTFSEVCDLNVSSATDPIIKCIYLRRKLEILGYKNDGYHVLSNLLHLREVPTWRPGKDEIAMPAKAVSDGVELISKEIPDFDYVKLLASVKRPGALEERFGRATAGYEKVQIFRILSVLYPKLMKGDDVFSKFVNETYHIENEYVMQLNPREFDAVPAFVISACAEMIDRVIGTGSTIS